MSTTTTKKKVSKVTEKFLTLSKPEQRVKIAKDVIAQIKAQKFTPKEGVYMGFEVPEEINKFEADAQSNLKNIIDCECCAMGACMLSVTKFANTLTLDELEGFDYNEDSRNMLKTYFPAKQLAKIEITFEKKDYIMGLANDYFETVLSETEIQKCYTFSRKYYTASERLTAIMVNIVANNGTFKP